MGEGSQANRRNAAETKAKILKAAEEAFARSSYTATGIREIAGMVGASTTILLRYFGSKAGLFEAALLASISDEPFPSTRGTFGQEVAQRLTHPDHNLSRTAMLALATVDTEAREIAARVIEARVISPLAEWLGPPHARARAEQVMTLCLGFVLFNRRLWVGTPLQGTNSRNFDWLARNLQELADGRS